MQSKIFSAVVAALSLSTVQCASVPRAIYITPTYIVTSGVLIDPNTLTSPQSIVQFLDNTRADVAKTAALAGQITNSTGNVLAIVSQATAVVGQITTNVATILAKVNALPTSPSPIPTPGASGLPDIGGAAENLVRSVQDLTKTITTQLDAIRAQATGLNTIVLNNVANVLQATLQTALNTLGTAVGVALSVSAGLTANVQDLANRIRNAKVKLIPVIVIGLDPSSEITF